MELRAERIVGAAQTKPYGRFDKFERGMASRTTVAIFVHSQPPAITNVRRLVDCGLFNIDQSRREILKPRFTPFVLMNFRRFF
jgi:hypothetical protein